MKTWPDDFVDKIICFDCLKVMRHIPDGVIDLIVTDPPYKTISGGSEKGLAYRYKGSILEKNDGKIFSNNNIEIDKYASELFRILKPQSHFYIMTNNINLQNVLNVCTNSGFKFHNLLVWKKNNFTANRWYMKNLEYILFFRKGTAKAINNMSSSQTIEVDNILGNKIHPTEKPVKLMQIMIENSSNENDIILDPFVGSGTTALA
jgi:site-specific DNA-methyltransferase (adenine-specific)